MKEQNKKGTPLWKALLLEHRLPYRYYQLFYKIASKFYNINTQNYWNKQLSGFKDGIWRNDVYQDLLGYFPKNGKFSLLDIGCAFGDGCILIKEKFPKAEISGCDFSDIGIKRAKDKNKKIKFFVLDISKQDLPKNYDYITMVSILEHFDNPLPVIDQVLEKTNKSLIINCPYRKYISEETDPAHRFAFNENTLKNYDHKCYIYRNRITYSVKGKI